MASIFEQSGTVNVTNGSRAVTGNGTAWLTAYDGVALNIDGLVYPVESIDSLNTMMLVRAYPGATALNVEYTLVPLQPTNYQLSKKVQDVLDVAGELVDATVGPAGPAGPLGPPGPAGRNGDAGFGNLVNFADYKAMPAGASGVYMIIPVAEGEPGMTLSQSSTVILPYDKPNAGAGIFIRAGVSGWALTLGLTNAPAPQPEVPGEDIDLSGSGTIYGAPGTIFDLGITVANAAQTFNLTAPAGLPLLIKRENPKVDPVASSWRLGTSGAPYPVTGNAVAGSSVLNKVGPANAFGFRNNNVVVLNTNGYLTTDALAMEFLVTADERLTQTPNRIRVSFKGVVPEGAEGGVLVSLMEYQVGEFRFEPYWDGQTLKVILGRNGSQEDVVSDPSELRVFGTNQLYEAEWTNNPNGDGGFMSFFINGQQIGSPKPTNTKPRITPAMPLEISASSGNTSVGIPGLEIESVGVSYDKPGIAISYVPANTGPISRADLQALAVDARNVTAPGPYVLRYAIGNGTPFELSINVGEMSLPAGRAYKAVLEDWSTGVGVPHPRELVMTRVAAQNCRFEDSDLYNAQASWTEVLPQGEVPNINGINYYCEGIRMGNYVQFQFIYDWDATQMPANPFGDPTNKESYMVAHKWMIYDNQGTLLARIEQPNGEPLNNPARPACWEGTVDGRGVAIVTANNRWQPHGTTRSSVIWRSHDPVAYDQQRIWNTVPTYDMRVPFGSNTGYSVNGGDARIYGDGQINGFANYRVMPWEPSDTNALIAAAAASPMPHRALLTETAITPNAGIWLKYTPFNQQGRSPVTGPGGTRDDRQIMPEMVAVYARDVNSTRPFDGRSMKQIALDYLTGYASDPVYGMENGRARPLYKGTGNARRNIRLRNHYYGYGEASVPESQAWYIQGGRTYEWMAGSNPLRVRVPRGGTDPKKPIFGTNMIDKAHAHQFPHWGSLLFQTPEFAMMGHKFSDQPRLYSNHILNDDDVNEIGNRETAWAYMHAALLWKTASSNSSRLYSRAEIMDWVIFDLEAFYDKHYDATPGFLNPPTNIRTGTTIDGNKAVYASNARFGITTCRGDSVYTHDFMVGYWLSALHAGHKLGFNQAVSAASTKAKAVIDWLVLSHEKRIIGRLTEGMLINAEDGTEYLTPLWTVAQINAASGNVSALPQNMAQVSAAQTKPSPSWDTCHDQYGNVQSRDGQSMDQFLAGPGLLMDMGRSSTALTNAYNIAEQYYAQKKAAEEAKGANAGTEWFVFHQATNNKPFKPS
jgi:hypothetical protein